MEAAMERWNTLSPEDIITVTFVWRIYNFSSCSGKKYSQAFYTDDYRWRILLYLKGHYVQHMSAYLEAIGSSNLATGWSRLARFKLTVVNQLDNRRSIAKGLELLSVRSPGRVWN
ncbi:ubiquitin C-terminal hydrolase 13-like isoform X2 [Argentina anserina]|uniref:ubiquitin C-terminal hydrolase 13-like isoform X2 n=1 Tax=Argentina anserina TaxID=57926 RepID=UPI0021767022|nr:ubiquitin C-terminal hydrolase 13-like isoform X2 [Potentilla anserina]